MSSVCARRARKRPNAFDRARSFALYDHALVKAILLLKFARIDPLGAWFADRLATLVAREQEKLAADVGFRYHFTGFAKRNAATTKPIG